MLAAALKNRLTRKGLCASMVQRQFPPRQTVYLHARVTMEATGTCSNPTCGDTFIKTRRNQLYCCDACRHASNNSKREKLMSMPDLKATIGILERQAFELAEGTVKLISQLDYLKQQANIQGVALEEVKEGSAKALRVLEALYLASHVTIVCQEFDIDPYDPDGGLDETFAGIIDD